MLKHFLTYWWQSQGLGYPIPADVEPETDDPMAHPAFRTMTAVELADIPFPRPERLRAGPVTKRCDSPC